MSISKAICIMIEKYFLFGVYKEGIWRIKDTQD
jgi:hypothetical protein